MEHGMRVSDSAYRKLAQMFKKNLDIPVVKQRKTWEKKDSIHSHQSNRSLALSETLQVRALIKFPPASSYGPTSAQRKGLRANGL